MGKGILQQKMLKSIKIVINPMIQELFRSLLHLLVPIALIYSILLTGLKSSSAATPGFSPPENYRNEDSLGMDLEPSEQIIENEVDEEGRTEDIFGSEQVFPFEMGLGNSAFW